MSRTVQLDNPKRGKNLAPPKEIEPDPQTAAGQWALWLRYHLPAKPSLAELASVVGVKSRQTAYNWYNGTSVPDVSLWQAIADYCGIPDAHTWSMAPPAEFVRYVRRYGKLPPDDRFSLKRPA